MGKNHNKIRYPFPALRCMGSVITHLAGSLSVLLVSSASHSNNDSLGALVCFITPYMDVNFFCSSHLILTILKFVLKQSQNLQKSGQSIPGQSHPMQLSCKAEHGLISSY